MFARSPAVLVGNMRILQILCSDWQPERELWSNLARFGLYTLIPRKKQDSLEQTWMKALKAVENNQRKETINGSRWFIALQCWLSF